MLGLLRSVIACTMVLLWSVQVSAQCAEGEEVCLEEESSPVLPIVETVAKTGDSITDQSVGQTSDESPVTLTDEITTETFTDEQASLVDGITRDLERRSLTLPVGNLSLIHI